MRARAASLSSVRSIVRCFVLEAGLDDRRVADAVLAVHEACANVCLHAYGADAERSVEVVARAAEERLEITVSDSGRPVARRPESRSGAGFGQRLMRSVSDEFTIEGPGEDGTRVRMIFALEPGSRA